jgi:predicted small metal-binding protein
MTFASRGFDMPEKEIMEFKCADLGMDCPYAVKTGSMEEMMANISGHASRVHNMNKIDPAKEKQIRAAIKRVKA